MEQIVRGPQAFIIAGALMVLVVAFASVGMILGGEPPGWFFPVVFVLFGLVLVGGAVGLFALHRTVRRAAPRLGVVGAGLAVVAGLAGLVFVGAGLTGRPPWELPETFYLAVVFGGLATFLASSLVLGAAVIATGTAPRAVGVLLVVVALIFLVPISDEALGWGAPEWLPVIIFGMWAGALLGAGLVWRGSLIPSAVGAHER